MTGFLGHLLIGLALLAGYGLFVLVKPDKTCGRCAGFAHRRGSACPRCQGTGRHFYPGAPLVHKGVAAAIRRQRERKEREQ